MNKGKEQTDLQTKEYLGTWTTIYLCLMVAVFSLATNRTMYDLLEVKTKLFYKLTISYIVGCLILLAAGYFSGQLKKTYKSDLLKKLWLLWTGLLMVDLLVTPFLVHNISLVLWGVDGRLYGNVFMALLLVVMVLVGYTFRKSVFLEVAVIITTIAESILIILNKYGTDPLKITEGFSNVDSILYMGTLGNIDIISNWLLVFAPVCLGGLIYSERIGTICGYALSLFMIIGAGIVTEADSFTVGMLAACAFFWLLCSRKEALYKRFLGGMFIIYLAFVVLYLIDFRCEFVMLFARRWWLAAGFYAFLYLCGKLAFGTKREKLFQRTLITVYIMVFVLLTVAFVFVNINPDNVEGGILSRLIINDSFGNYRGGVWIRICKEWKDTPLLFKIFGYSMGGFMSFFQTANDEMIALTDYYYMDAHNEFLQFLVTSGVVGTLSYFGLFVVSIVRGLTRKTSIGAVASAVCLVWLVQGIVNNPMVLTTPYLFIAFGIVMSKDADEREDKEQKDSVQVTPATPKVFSFDLFHWR